MKGISSPTFLKLYHMFSMNLVHSNKGHFTLWLKVEPFTQSQVCVKTSSNNNNNNNVPTNCFSPVVGATWSWV